MRSLSQIALGAGTVYVLPKRRRARFGPEWKGLLEDPGRPVRVPKRVLQTESARDDARVGQGAIRTDHPPGAGGLQEMAIAGIAILHNVFTTRVPR